MKKYHLAMVGLLLICLACAEDGEIWVAVEDRIEIFSDLLHTDTRQVEGMKHIIGMSAPTSLTSPNNTSIFVTELGTKGPSVYRLDQHKQTLLAKDTTTSYFSDLTYDPTSQQLFLTSMDQRAVYSMMTSKGAGVTKLFSSKGKTPIGIDMDICSRTVYWTNSRGQVPSVEVFSAGTSESRPLVTGNLTRPRAISVDQAGRRVYWSDTFRGSFSISRAGLDGRDRELVCEGRNHEPFSMVVTESFIYWTDWASQGLWRARKQGECKPELVKMFPTSRPHGVTWVREQGVTCDQTSPVTFPALTTDPVTEKVEIEKEDKEEADQCTNYCLGGGSCILGPTGQPFCACPEGWTGPRCQGDPCTNFCLQQGSSCLVLAGRPECICPAGYSGYRCQESSTVLSSTEASLPVSSLTNISTTVLTETSSAKSHSPDMLEVLVFCLGTSTGLLATVVVCLVVLVCRLRTRPRLSRKRFIKVPKAEKLDHRSVTRDDGVTLDIEDCCNMTLCDTPCFDPPTRGPAKSKKKSRSCGGGKSGDKLSLLGGEDDI